MPNSSVRVKKCEIKLKKDWRNKWADELFENKGLYLEVLEDNLNARNFYHRMGAKHQATNLWQPPGSDEKD